LRTRIEAFCNSSSQSLDLMLPSLYDEELGRCLALAVSRGAKVRLLMNPRFEISRQAAASLAALMPTGFELRWADFNARLILVDGQRGLLGSFNGIADSLDKKTECAAEEDDAKLAAGLQASFDALWKSALKDLPEMTKLDDALKALPSPQDPEDTQPRLKTERRKL
jgi:phosphatidylserine/phosphatidylglycerophosphate/cardiolipin synthase-like enzyme